MPVPETPFESKGSSKIVAVVPARYGSERFPGKPLAKIQGKPMIQWVLEGVLESRIIKKVILATDDERIARSCTSLPVKVVMTDPHLSSGSDRVFQACESEPEPLVINVQGDEPLISGVILDQMAGEMLCNNNNDKQTGDQKNQDSILQDSILVDENVDQDWDMMTFGCQMNLSVLKSPKTVKIVLDQFHKALYFSRHPIPYSRKQPKSGDGSEDFSGSLKHIGVYGFKKAFLKKFCQTPPVPLEEFEGLEQLRALYLGASIKVLRTDQEIFGVDTPEDLVFVENFLKRRKTNVVEA